MKLINRYSSNELAFYFLFTYTILLNLTIFFANKNNLYFFFLENFSRLKHSSQEGGLSEVTPSPYPKVNSTNLLVCQVGLRPNGYFSWIITLVVLSLVFCLGWVNVCVVSLRKKSHTTAVYEESYENYFEK